MSMTEPSPPAEHEGVLGAAPLPDGRLRVRVWAPDHQVVSVVIDEHEWPLDDEGLGIFTGIAPGRTGSRYGFRLSDSPTVLPDPASRSQPDGASGLSEVIDPLAFAWSDHAWRGRADDAHVLYELHCGTFTPEGTWDAATRELDRLVDLGVTTLQIMPANTFAGEFGWGYDGVFWYAPYHRYGRPDDLRRFVDQAHARQLSVIMDVVYNHLGPRDCVLGAYTTRYFTDRYPNEWGQPLNFDGEGSQWVRQLVVDNAVAWVREYHVDGLRLDATQQMFDSSPVHIVAELTTAVRAVAPDRPLLVLAENEPQDTALLRAAGQPAGVDVLYNDDFHHTARVRLTGWREAYYSDYTGSSAELVACAQHGFLFQGQRSGWQKQPRGTPALHVEASRFLCFLENHDQVANSHATGRRLHRLAEPGLLRALTTLVLLGPWTPLLFQGQEYGAPQPWVYFADHPGELGRQVREGRHAFMSQFSRLALGDESTFDPIELRTFERCKLAGIPDDPYCAEWLALHRDLLALRHRRRRLGACIRPLSAAPDADLLALRDDDPTDPWLLAVNLGSDRDIAGLAAPVLAPPRGRAWQLVWSSDAVRYGGSGMPPVEADRILIPGASAVVLGMKGDVILPSDGGQN
jgi:maltooligosyltrehalose trehalohydrolase